MLKARSSFRYSVGTRVLPTCLSVSLAAPRQLVIVALVPVDLKGASAADIGNADRMFEGFMLWVIDHVERDHCV